MNPISILRFFWGIAKSILTIRDEHKSRYLKYLKVSLTVALALLLVTFTVFAIVYTAPQSGEIAEDEKLASSSVILRYYCDDDFAVAPIAYTRVTAGEKFRLSNLPQKEGYTLAGLYDAPDHKTGTLYVMGTGECVIPLTDDILLYPIFVKE